MSYLGREPNFRTNLSFDRLTKHKQKTGAFCEGARSTI